jgi:hypothetical protein
MTSALTTAAENMDLITETLRQLNMIRTPEVGLFSRAKIAGATFELADEVYVSNQKTKAPAFFGRLLDLPLEYNGMWLTPDDAARLGRPDAADTYCKSYKAIPEQAFKFAEDGTDCNRCNANPWIKRDQSPLENGKKCGWRADVLFHLTDEMGTDLEATTYTLSLSVTGVIELMGSTKAPEKGSVSEYNFYHKLAIFSIGAFPNIDPAAAIAQGSLALRAGRVIAGFRLQQQTNENGSRTWYVPVLDPHNIILEDDAPAPVAAIEAGDTAPPAAAAGTTAADFDDLPF